MGQQFAREDFCSDLERRQIDHWYSDISLAQRKYLYEIHVVNTTEYTQIGNGRFLAYIPLQKLAQAGDDGGGGRYTPTFFYSIYHHVQSCSVRSSWESRNPISPLPLCILYREHEHLS